MAILDVLLSISNGNCSVVQTFFVIVFSCVFLNLYWACLKLVKK